MPSDLEGLLERVKAANGPDGWLDGAIGAEFADVSLPARAHASQHGFVVTASGAPPDHGCGTYNPTPLYTASVDAALALVERVMPDGWWWDFGITPPDFRTTDDKTGFGFELRSPVEWYTDEYDYSSPDFQTFRSDGLATLALAAVASLLSALIEQRKAEPKQGEG